MLKIYIKKSNASSKKLVGWLNQKNIAYQERYIDKYPLTEKELLYILSLTENGFEDIFSVRTMKNMNLGSEYIQSLSVKELVKLMVDNPVLIRKPFVIKEKRLIVGYGHDQLRTLTSKEIRAQDYLNYQLEMLRVSET